MRISWRSSGRLEVDQMDLPWLCSAVRLFLSFPIPNSFKSSPQRYRGPVIKDLWVKIKQKSEQEAHRENSDFFFLNNNL